MSKTGFLLAIERRVPQRRILDLTPMLLPRISFFPLFSGHLGLYRCAFKGVKLPEGRGYLTKKVPSSGPHLQKPLVTWVLTMDIAGRHR